jgi:hypothetical protein
MRTFSRRRRTVSHTSDTEKRFVFHWWSDFDGVNTAPLIDQIILLTMMSAFIVLCGESVPYGCIEIIALFSVVSSIGSSRIAALVLIIRGPVAML